MPEFCGNFLPIEEGLTTLAGGKRGKADEKWRKIDQNAGVGGSGNTP